MGMGDIIRDMGDVRPFLCPSWFFAGFFVKTAVLKSRFRTAVCFFGIIWQFFVLRALCLQAGLWFSYLFPSLQIQLCIYHRR